MRSGDIFTKSEVREPDEEGIRRSAMGFKLQLAESVAVQLAKADKLKKDN